jgi:hypothetical protein
LQSGLRIFNLVNFMCSRSKNTYHESTTLQTVIFSIHQLKHCCTEINQQKKLQYLISYWDKSTKEVTYLRHIRGTTIPTYQCMLTSWVGVVNSVKWKLQIIFLRGAFNIVTHFLGTKLTCRVFFNLLGTELTSNELCQHYNRT